MLDVVVNTLVKSGVSNAEITRIVKVASTLNKKIKGLVEINVVGNKAIQDLNRRYRGLDKPTDVLSFSWQEEKSFPSEGLGQIYLAYPYIVRQAKRFQTTPEAEFTRMLVHGLLHVTGYDHVEERDAQKMFALQERIVAAVLSSKK